MARNAKAAAILITATCLSWAGGLACGTVVEAESTIILGTASVYDDPSASGSQGLAYISSPSSGLRIPETPAASGVDIRYASTQSGSLSVFVNGDLIGPVDFSSTGAWVGTYGLVFLAVDIPAKANFEIIFQNGDTAMNIDLIRFRPPKPSAPDPEPDPASLGESQPGGAGLIAFEEEMITTRFAERFRQRHESDLNHDTYINEYAQGSAYEIILIDRPDSLEVQIHSPQAPLSMVNFTHDHILNPGFADPPQYRSGGFMAKGSLDGPVNDDSNQLATRLYFEVRSTNGRPWSEVRSDQEIVTLEFTPRRELNGQFPQYYSDIFRYRAGQGGITFERNDARYFAAGPTTHFAHGSPGFEFSQPYLGIDQSSLHTFTLGRELFRASFQGDPLPGNGGQASGADPEAQASACLDCHFQLGKAAPPGRGSEQQQGFIHDGNDLRVAPSLIGLGLLEAVDASTIEQRALLSGGKVPDGRFGWKATEATLRDQILKAFALDIGAQNISDTFVDRIEEYIRSLGVPIRRHPTETNNQAPNVGVRVPDTHTIMDADILDGEAAFNESGCTNCHVPAMQTGNDHPVAQFRNIIIRPFTDLLLWDMGPELCADSNEGNADRCEWRTAPLWGLRLQEQVTGHATFLHDGRATTLEEAIRLHGGDAQAAREAYMDLPTTQRANLLLYLNSL